MGTLRHWHEKTFLDHFRRRCRCLDYDTQQKGGARFGAYSTMKNLFDKFAAWFGRKFFPYSNEMARLRADVLAYHNAQRDITDRLLRILEQKEATRRGEQWGKPCCKCSVQIDHSLLSCPFCKAAQP
jgi:hypothetical protein